MSSIYAEIAVDLSVQSLDHPFSYLVPQELENILEPGNVVRIPFGNGNRVIRGYVLRLVDHTSLPSNRVKQIQGIETDFAGEGSKLIALALWMSNYYGSSTIQALRTVLPARKKTSEKQKRTVFLQLSGEELSEKLDFYEKKKQKARLRLLQALAVEKQLPYEVVTGTLRIPVSLLKTLQEQGILSCESRQIYRTPQLLRQLYQEETEKHPVQEALGDRTVLNEEQRAAAEEICGQLRQENPGCFLLHGITGSGKTEVYMEVIARVLDQGKQAILLIPEISLTYQNVIRFYRRFGDRISILHSRLSPAERYDQFERAKKGDIDIMIGPRSALFTPFEKLGVIIMDEEHESSYHSETVPRYETREVAEKRARLEHACLVLGSATPSVEAYYQAAQGSLRLLRLTRRAAGGQLPQVQITDLRKEMREGNRSVFGRLLLQKLQDRLQKKEQSILFLNRRGYSGFVMCRECGTILKCPHCDISLSLHKNGRLICHYCGYQSQQFSVCPSCGSSYIGGFRAGTQQIEEQLQLLFPSARILRMDADTTRGKDGHLEIVRSFAAHEADILLGTQMIVKGHDFPDVTLVGILAADLSLYVNDYRAAEKTFQLLTQAAGRAGRRKDAGEVVIQTYTPEHFSIQCAASQDYERFFQQEMRSRMLTGYPPAGCLLCIHMSSPDHILLETAAGYLAAFARQISARYQTEILGPVDENIAKLKDQYRKIIYIKQAQSRKMTAFQQKLEEYIALNAGYQTIDIQFERK